MRNIRTTVVFWIVVGVSLLGFAGCQAVSHITHKDMVVACIENGGTWIDGDTTRDSKSRTIEKIFRQGDRCVPNGETP